MNFDLSRHSLKGEPAASPRLLLAAGILIYSIALPHWYDVLLCIISTLCYAWLQNGTPPAQLFRRAFLPLIFAAMGAASLPFELLWEQGGPRVSMGSQAEFQHALFVLLRSTSAILATMTLILSLRIEVILSATRRLHIPQGLVEVALLVHMLIFELQSTQERMWTACIARQGSSGPRALLRTSGMMASALWVQAFSQARARQTGLASRGLESLSLCTLVDSPTARPAELWAVGLLLLAIAQVSILGEIFF